MRIGMIAIGVGCCALIAVCCHRLCVDSDGSQVAIAAVMVYYLNRADLEQVIVVGMEGNGV